MSYDNGTEEDGSDDGVGMVDIGPNVFFASGGGLNAAVLFDAQKLLREVYFVRTAYARTSCLATGEGNHRAALRKFSMFQSSSAI